MDLIKRKWHFAAPFFMPFVFLGMFRLVWWVAGASWDYPSLAALLSLTFGMIVGGMIIPIRETMP